MLYLSIDVETTGYDPKKHQVIEFAAILEATELHHGTGKFVPQRRRVENLKSFHAFFRVARRWSQGAFKFHYDNGFFDHYDLETRDDPYEDEEDTFVDDFVSWLLEYIPDDRDKDGRIRFNVAGKNPTFDLDFLAEIPGWSDRFAPHHRLIDPTIFFWKPDDRVLPDLQTCLERAGIDQTVKHRAMDDAEAVIHLVRYVWGLT